MDKFIIITLLVTAVLLVVAGGAVVYSSSTGGAYTESGALQKAKEYVSNEATYKFDGMSDTLNVTIRSAPKADTFEFVAEFTCRSAGYGDRSDRMSAMVLTPHQAVITVEKGKVTSAVMDGQWDMMTQKEIPGLANMPRMNGNNALPNIGGNGGNGGNGVDQPQ